jgi:hypothetical protein
MAAHRFEVRPPEREPVRPAPRRKVYGYVYELITGDPVDGEHPYVGMTEQTIHQRVHGPGGHTSRESVARDPWKARIRPGRAGYRCLERVYDTGDPAENDRALRRAEAFWIDRLRPTHNTVRPVRPPAHETQPPKRRPAAPRPPARRRRRVPARALVFLFVALTFSLIAGRAVAYVTTAGHWSPAVPWIVGPVVGAFLAWRVFWSAHRSLRKLMR